MPKAVLDSEIELASSATMAWLETATDTEVVMYAKTALQRICLLCRKPGHLAAQCPNGCRHCGAKPHKATGWVLHKPACPIKQRMKRDFRSGQAGAGGARHLVFSHRHLVFSADNSRPRSLLVTAQRRSSLVILRGRLSRLLDQEGAAHTVQRMLKALRRPSGKQLRRQLLRSMKKTLNLKLLSHLRRS